MSLVGPRPLILDEDRHVDSWARRRLDLRPGITGMWQVLGRDESASTRWSKLDYLYVTTWSLWRDFEFLLETFPAIVRSRRPTDAGCRVASEFRGTSSLATRDLDYHRSAKPGDTRRERRCYRTFLGARESGLFRARHACSDGYRRGWQPGTPNSDDLRNRTGCRREPGCAQASASFHDAAGGASVLNAAILYAITRGDPRSVETAALIAVAVVPATLTLRYSLALLQGLQRFTAFNLLRVAPATLNSVVLFLLWMFHSATLVPITLAYTLTTIAAACVALSVARRAGNAESRSRARACATLEH